MKNKSVQDRWIENMMHNRPLWYDSDMWKAGAVGLCIGIVIGIIFRG
jgi:hypothetical protein